MAKKLSPDTAAPLSTKDPVYSDGETTLPTKDGKTWSHEQWLDALSSGECNCETLIRGVADSIDANPEACWELLALVDQYYRRHRIKDSDFHNLNLLGQALLIKSMPNAAVAAPQSSPPPVAPAPPLKRATVAVNDTLRNRYRIEGILGRGGMGTVYSATDLHRPDYIPSDQRIALKVLHSEVVRRPGLLTEIRAEFQCLQSLSHPNIIRVHEFDQDGDISFFTMEQLTGAPLSQVLAEQSKALHRPYALAIIQQAGAAVAYAHSRGIVHGDLNPANIFITQWGELRVLDFGAASRTRGDQALADANDMTFRIPVATPSYASCEQLESKDPTTDDDVYAMACIAYVLLTGEHPFRGRNSLAARQAHQAPRRPAGISTTQWRALKAGLKFDPRHRPADMKAWLKRFSMPSVPSLLPSLATIRSGRSRPRRLGPPVLSALIALTAGLIWWSQDQYGWLKTSAADAAIRTTAAAIQSTVSDTQTSLARAAPAGQKPPAPQTPAVAPAQPTPAPEPPVIATHTAASTATVNQGSAQIDLTTNAIDVPFMQPVASIPVSRRHNYRAEVSFTWSTESGTAKPGQDFIPVNSRTEYIPAGARQARLLVPIVQNPARHLSRTFYVVVNTPGDGATLGARTITQVTIPASD